MDRDNPPLRLTIPSDLRLLPVVRNFIEGACQVGGVDRETADAIVLATHEAVSNVIRHAHRGDRAAQLQLECRPQPDGMEIYLLDEGEPFDLTAVPDLDPAEIRIGGRGVFLMRRLMDELKCLPRGCRGNALRMVKRCARDCTRSAVPNRA